MDEAQILEEKLSNLIFLKKKMTDELANWQDQQNLDVVSDPRAYQDAQDRMEDLDNNIAETREQLLLLSHKS